MPWHTAATKESRRDGSEGLRRALRLAEGRDDAGDVFGAKVLRAQAYYRYFRRRKNPLQAFWEFALARIYARSAAHEARQRNLRGVTAKQCSVIGTILLHDGLWFKARPEESLGFFRDGFGLCESKLDHALLCIGLAEAHYALGDAFSSHQYAVSAMRSEEQIDPERTAEDSRYSVEVLCRAMALCHRLGQLGRARDCYRRCARVIGEILDQGLRLSLHDTLQRESQVLYAPPARRRLLFR